MRHTLVFLTALFLVAPAFGQPTRPASPISADALDRLNLRAEWNTYIPVNGKLDGLERVQPVDTEQVYVQTREGLLVAVDARTGRQQWSHKFPATNGASFPVAVNAKYCYAVGIGKLFCFDRYTGSLMLEQDLREAFPHREETPVAGPVVDNRNVFIQMASGWLVNYRAPLRLQVTPVKADDAKAGTAGQTNVVDRVARQYATARNTQQVELADPEYRVRMAPATRSPSFTSQQATPSVSALYSVVPPYQLDRSHPVPSIAILPGSVHQPYKFVPDHMKYRQFTPSVSSQSALYRLEEDSNLRAVGDKFMREWRHVPPDRASSRPLLVDNASDPFASRVWVSTVGEAVLALNKAKGTEEVVGQLPGKPLTPMVGPYAFSDELVLGFVPLDSGVVLAVELTSGFRSPDRKATPVVYHWRSPVGGQMSNPPVCGADAVYVSGARNGCVKLDGVSGETKWRTGLEIDQVLAVNADYVYARDQRGKLAIFPVNGRPDPRTGLLRSVGQLDLAEFSTAITNTTTDRILLGGDNGMLTSLRGAAAKYAKPARIAPPAAVPPPKPAPKKPVEMQPKDE